ncbi:MAG: hypothetical protein HUU55_24110 [Myxococcales bacterium]|nr:hypothetical protein [Myxococcales bacterium]
MAQRAIKTNSVVPVVDLGIDPELLNWCAISKQTRFKATTEVLTDYRSWYPISRCDLSTCVVPRTTAIVITLCSKAQAGPLPGRFSST